MKPAKLKRHLLTKHPEYINKPKEFFHRKGEEYFSQRTRLTKLATTSERAQKASYLVAQRIAKHKKAHTIAEELILPSAVDMCEVMIRTEAANKLKRVPLSNDTVRQRIDDLSDDILSQLLGRLRCSGQYSIQLDESTDIASAAQLIALVRYPWGETILEDFLFCKAVPGRATGEEIFRLLDEFINEAGLSWGKCVAVCTDGAAAMTGRKSGVVARIKAVNPNVKSVHCMLHRQALASKAIEPDLHLVLNKAVAAVNFVKSRALQTRLFGQLCQEMDAGHDTLLYHSEVRWLSRGKVLQRVFELRTEMSEFMRTEKPDIAEFFSHPVYVAKLAYLVDVFNALNSLNLSIQGRYASILEVSDKLTAFMRKAELWQRRLQDGVTDMFPQLTEFLLANNLPVTVMKEVATSHLTALSKHFTSYFSDVNTDAWDWVRDPFAPAATYSLTGKAEEELVDLSCDRTLKARFQQVSHAEFWPSLAFEYPELTAHAMQILLPFPTTYLCESSFSTLTAMKTKYRARLHVESDLRVCLSSITPRLDKLCSERQAHPSH
ncbi:SCAN domain-containing protein 3-like [Neoarius graeffei]|uniref:SCAN domain-containing protein 3-like n=1 Tax=Neoarius graeffei TaxID=443677 RepID=UPI00298C8D89|nr:SCAN domain-containing protein 3-like [Neoarius graeffei]